MDPNKLFLASDLSYLYEIVSSQEEDCEHSKESSGLVEIRQALLEGS